MFTKGINKRLKDMKAWDSRPVHADDCHGTAHDCAPESGWFKFQLDVSVSSSVRCWENLRDINKDKEPVTLKAPTSL